MNLPLPEDMLFDFFDGKTSPLQEKLIEEWLSIPADEEFFYQSLEAWEIKKLQYVPDTEKSLQ